MNQYIQIPLNIYFLELKLQIKLHGEMSQVMLQKGKWDWSFYLSDDFTVSSSVHLQLLLFDRVPSVIIICQTHNLSGDFIHRGYGWLLNQLSGPNMYIQLLVGLLHLDNQQTSQTPHVHSELTTHHPYFLPLSVLLLLNKCLLNK